MKKISCLLTIVLFATGCAKKGNPADWIIYGKIWTGNSSAPWAEGVAVSGDSIIGIGNAAALKKFEGNRTTVTKLDDNALVLPGFIDTHTHFVDGGFRLSSVKLRDAASKAEFIKRIKDFASTVPAGTWIIGGDWDHQLWGGELPDRTWIDSITQKNPVWINRLDGHMNLANSAALTALKIKDDIKDVDGGTIVRGKNRRLTGIFKDNAATMIEALVPPPTEVQEDGALQAAMAYVAEKGVTSVHNMFDFMPALERAHAAHQLKTRIYAGMHLRNWKALREKIDTEGPGDAWLKIGLLKGFADGSLGSHTAAFFKPFSDSPTDSGFFITSEKDLYTRTKSADSAGLQVTVHAIGDKAIHSILNIFERVEKENGPKDRRFRIEHVQHIDPRDVPRFAALGVIASMQPYHAIDDGRWAEKVIGKERSKTTYAFRSLLDAKAKLVFGSDWFVAPPAPLEGIYAAATRRTLDGKNPGGWFPEQKITVEEAVKAYTIDAAYSSFDEKIKGSLEPGKLADMVILDADIFKIAPEKIREVRVLKTIVGGKPVYKAK